MKILIVGAGLAGLSLARALLNRGIHADIIERRPDWNTPGFGLFLPGNASRALADLGLLSKATHSAVPIRRQDFYDYRGTYLSTIDSEAFWADCGPCLGMPRAVMHAILRESVAELPIRTGRTIAKLRQVAEGCLVTFDDDSTETYDLVVGADGLNSRVRQMAIDPAPPTYTGNGCWRFFAANVPGIDAWTVMVAKGRTMLAEPIDRSTLYVYIDITQAANDPRELATGAELQAIFADFAAPLGPLLEQLLPATPLHFSRIETVRPKADFSGRVVLIGDAAHATSPSMAEGAGMAFEDAVLLADAITATDDLGAALEGYAARRNPRVSWVQKQSEARDRLRRLPLAISGGLLRYAGGSLYRRSYTPLLAEA
ncbi:MAG: FAD-dependent monooxygenase [Aurantimonas endophytica]|uniref:2-polyprenyl-6-methoxyphenol hydroxylase-like FAD-dependent oxidoreductase n=1 Tax=Aurantimonas endophytica TaxID=1522175 RepID=A0A7W6MQ62_9HYPH|nr:2-polyprenyl-6-methoxyphenol hydroxylase-like FAD-dependent oxidoreductase [Aurantimonas endophytica]MCO6404477.1 NAD(P)-binding protein [Aurantimonas endophytica]